MYNFQLIFRLFIGLKRNLKILKRKIAGKIWPAISFVIHRWAWAFLETVTRVLYKFKYDSNDKKIMPYTTITPLGSFQDKQYTLWLKPLKQDMYSWTHLTVLSCEDETHPAS